MAYRNRRAQERQEKLDKLAVQDWETDGGGNLPVPSATSANTSRAQPRPL
jgi:hypothetical protein